MKLIFTIIILLIIVCFLFVNEKLDRMCRHADYIETVLVERNNQLEAASAINRAQVAELQKRIEEIADDWEAIGQYIEVLEATVKQNESTIPTRRYKKITL